MPKINLIASLKGNTTNHHVSGKGIIKDEKLIYQDSDVKVIVERQDDKVNITRSNGAYDLNLLFILNKRTIGQYNIKEFSMNIDADIYTKELIQNNKEIFIVYDLTLGGEFLGEYTYHLSYEVK